LAFIFRNLWRSRRRIDSPDRDVPASTPLSALEKPARRLLGPRPPGTPLASWLRPLAARLGDPGDLEEALSLHQKLRFDPGCGSDPGLVERLAVLASGLRTRIAR